MTARAHESQSRHGRKPRSNVECDSCTRRVWTTPRYRNRTNGVCAPSWCMIDSLETAYGTTGSQRYSGTPKASRVAMRIWLYSSQPATLDRTTYEALKTGEQRERLPDSTVLVSCGGRLARAAAEAPPPATVASCCPPPPLLLLRRFLLVLEALLPLRPAEEVEERRPSLFDLAAGGCISLVAERQLECLLASDKQQ